RGEAAAEYRHDVFLRIGNDFDARQLQPAFTQQLNEMRHVLVLPAAREDLVADEDETDAWNILRHDVLPERRYCRRASSPKCANTSDENTGMTGQAGGKRLRRARQNPMSHPRRLWRRQIWRPSSGSACSMTASPRSMRVMAKVHQKIG